MKYIRGFAPETEIDRQTEADKQTDKERETKRKRRRKRSKVGFLVPSLR